MKIYRIPKTEADEFEHFYTPMGKMTTASGKQFTDKLDLSEKIAPWHGETFVKVNLSDEKSMKKSVAVIVFEEEDVIALHQKLVEGLREKRNSWEQMEKSRAISNNSNMMKEMFNR